MKSAAPLSHQWDSSEACVLYHWQCFPTTQNSSSLQWLPVASLMTQAFIPSFTGCLPSLSHSPAPLAISLISPKTLLHLNLCLNVSFWKDQQRHIPMLCCFQDTSRSQAHRALSHLEYPFGLRPLPSLFSQQTSTHFLQLQVASAAKHSLNPSCDIIM